MIKVEILEKDIFAAIVPNDVEKYLSTNNWTQKRQLPNDVAIWSKRDQEGQIYRLWLPLDDRLADFSEIMKRSIAVIAQEENRSQLELLEDFNTIAIGDIIRLTGFDDLNRNRSSVPLSYGKALIEQAKNLITAAAMSEVQPREVHPSRKSTRVNDYIKNIRLGQTESGSYIVKLVSPIEEIIEGENPTLPNIPPKLPFGRRAVIRLVSGLEAARDVAHDIHHRGKFDIGPFLEAVPQGVSANLCEAIVNQSQLTNITFRPLDVSVTWSYALPSTNPTGQANINFPIDYMHYISKAAREFRAKYPEKVELVGI